ncbi:MAG: histidinol dehydrogenase [Phycisphaerales bacterium]
MTPHTNPSPLLRVVSADEVSRERRAPVDPETLGAAGGIVESVRVDGIDAVRRYAEQFGERGTDQALVLGRAEMDAAAGSLDPDDLGVLERTAARIESFAKAQLDAIGEIDVPVPGGRAGHTVEPVQSAGCYAPAGRYPLPSSVLMTAVTARVAGCDRVIVASPGADPVMLAAASVAGADAFLAVGGAHSIAALAYGIDGLDPVDAIVGPGNRWVTAAKQLVSGVVGIDMLAGPSELLIIADETADARLVAADLLAQAEHDDDARACLVTTSDALRHKVERKLQDQLERLPTAATARVALRNGFACLVPDIDAAIRVSDRIAPEHLEIMVADAPGVAQRVRHAGAVFIGSGTPEALGDYGAGPNHTLPTGGTARFRAGLSVASLLRLRTWLRIDERQQAGGLMHDTRRLASMEGLAAHEASIRLRV